MENNKNINEGPTIKRSNGLKYLRAIWRRREIGIIIPIALLIIIAQIINPVFLKADNIINILRSTGFTLITGIGMTLVFISGGLDLSVGSVLAVGSIATTLAISRGVPIVLAIFIGLAIGLVLGMINGLIIIKFRIPPLMMTLGMYYMARGLVLIFTEGKPVYPLPDAFQLLEQTFIVGIPIIVIISIVLIAIFQFILNRTVFGRELYAVGGNKEAARICGINIGKITFLAYAITGMLAAFTGILVASRLGTGQPNIGLGHELTVIAAVIIGGTSISGGTGTIVGTALGALFMSILSNSMTIMRISVYWQNFVIGVILVVAVILDQYQKQKTFGSNK